MKKIIPAISIKGILFLAILSFNSSNSSWAQTPCEKADKLIIKAWAYAENADPVGFMRKAYKLCPESENVNFQIARIFVSIKRYDEGIPYLNNTLSINPGNRAALNYKAAINFCLGNFAEARRDYKLLLSTNDNSNDSTVRLLEEYHVLLAYMDTVEYLGDEYLHRHIKKRYKPEDTFNPEFVSGLFKADPFDGYKNNNGNLYSSGAENRILAFRLGLDDNAAGLLKAYPESPYSFWYYAEDRRESNDRWYATPNSKYNPSFADIEDFQYRKASEYYMKVLEVVPNHIPTFVHLADINYFNENYTISISYYKRIIESLAPKEQSSALAMQSWRMIRRIEWLQSIDGNPVKRNTLYFDKGRLDETLSTVGTIGNYVGDATTLITGKVGYAYAGIAFNGATLIIQQERLNTDWFFKLKKEEAWQDLYQKCLNQLPRHLNNGGFYSEETIQMLVGIYLGGRNLQKSFDEYKFHVRALVDNVWMSGRKENLYLSAGILAGIYLLRNDNDLTDFERFKLINMINGFNETMMSNGHENFILPQDKAFLDIEKARINRMAKKL